MMKRKYKKLLLLLVIVGTLFAVGGCAAKTELDPETGERRTKLITTETTFGDIQKEEGWFETFLVYPLAQSVNTLSPIVSVPGAIAIITFLVNALVFALTFKSTLASQKMQLIQPEMNKINEKYKDRKDAASMNAKNMEIQKLYQKHDINMMAPFVQFLQLPIVISIYHAVQRSEAVYYGSFLGMKLSVSPFNGVFKDKQWIYIILLVIVMAFQVVSMKLPTYLSEKAAREAAEAQGKRYRPAPNQMGNMMNGMLVMVLVFSVFLPAGMGIYWIMSSLVQILKSLYMQYHTKKQKGRV